MNGSWSVSLRFFPMEYSNPVSQENVQLARRHIDAWNRGDLDAWVELFHPNCEYISELIGRMEGSDNVFRGREGVRRFWDEWHSVWDITVEVSEIRDLGDTVLTIGRNRARGSASGVNLDVPMAYVAEVEGGLTRRLRAYHDPVEALEAVGLSPQGDS
jgi:ketosteroid isomerase-like protein